MRSKTSKRIQSETTSETKDKALNYAKEVIMKTTTLLPERDYFLQDNQIHFKSRTENAGCEIEIEGQRIVMGASTDHTLPAVRYLDRTLFVNKEDVEELAEKHVSKKGYNKNNHKALFQHINEKNNFIAGYNANKGEFTREEMEIAIKEAGFLTQQGNHFKVAIRNIINSLRPLSLPKSIEVDEQYNVIKVNR